MSHCFLQVKQALLVSVLLHDHTGHFRTREVAQRGLWEVIYDYDWAILQGHFSTLKSSSKLKINDFLHLDLQIGGVPVLFVVCSINKQINKCSTATLHLQRI